LNDASSVRPVPVARYDAAAEFYRRGWSDTYDDPVTMALLKMAGSVRERRVLDIGCGHGRISRELARRGAHVTAADVSTALLEAAQALESEHPMGISYLQVDVAGARALSGMKFDLVVASFALTDFDDLDGTAATVSRVLTSDGRFVFSMLHPCFAGGPQVAPSWPRVGSYYQEGWWQADPEDRLSTLRQQVGSNHRMLSTYLRAFHQAGLRLEDLAEPDPSREWGLDERHQHTQGPVFLVATFRHQ
jgi:ubiquinone/menaquinone biosynthesis C-methylase UbiE